MAVSTLLIFGDGVMNLKPGVLVGKTVPAVAIHRYDPQIQSFIALLSSGAGQSRQLSWNEERDIDSPDKRFVSGFEHKPVPARKA